MNIKVHFFSCLPDSRRRTCIWYKCRKSRNLNLWCQSHCCLLFGFKSATEKKLVATNKNSFRSKMPVGVHSGWRLQGTQRLMGFHARDGRTLKVSSQRWETITTVATLKRELWGHTIFHKSHWTERQSWLKMFKSRIMQNCRDRHVGEELISL